MVASMGPSEAVLAATVARRYYLLGEAKKDIATDLGISRFKVARLLESAAASGLVRFEISPVGGIDLDLSAQMQERFALARCVVVADSSSPAADRGAELGAVAAAVVSEMLTDHDVLGLPWSRSVLAMTTALRELPAVRVVQLSGAIELPGINASAVDIVRETARISGGQSVIFHAPFILDDVSSAQALRRQASVIDGLQAITEVTHAVVGLGVWSPTLSTVFDMITEVEQQELSAAGVIGEIAGVFFDAQGRVIESGVGERLITLSGADLLAIPSVTAIVAGAPKAPAVSAAITGGFVDGLVTDASLATAMLATPHTAPAA